MSYNGVENKGVKKLVLDGVPYESLTDISNIFNTYFCSVGSALEEKIPTTEVDPLSCIRDRLPTTFFLRPVTAYECGNIILGQKNSKTDINSITVRLIKENSDILAPIFADIANTCFSSGVFPSEFKRARVIPIHKKGDPTDPSNYRPISLLPFFSKVLEKFINNRLITFLTKFSIISRHQYGFQRGLSTEKAISAFCEEIFSNLNNHKLSVSIFIDLQKAYDTINHGILLRKLEICGIRGIPLRLISSFLSHRSQVVSINFTLSREDTVLSGLPTGSVLSCMLFLIFINDLPNISDLFSPTIYADDTTLTFAETDISRLETNANIELNKFLSWTYANRLSVNPNKSFQLFFLHVSWICQLFILEVP